MSDIDTLQHAVKERDLMIAQLKNKTKEFVAKLKEDHAQQINVLKAENNSRIQEITNKMKADIKLLNDNCLSEVQHVQSSLEEMREKYNEECKVTGELKNSIGAMNELRTRFDSVSSKNGELNDKIASLELELVAVKEAKVAADAKALDSELWQSKEHEYEVELAQLTDRCANCEYESNGYKAELANKDSVIDTLTNEISGLRERLAVDNTEQTSDALGGPAAEEAVPDRLDKEKKNIKKKTNGKGKKNQEKKDVAAVAPEARLIGELNLENDAVGEMKLAEEICSLKAGLLESERNLKTATDKYEAIEVELNMANGLVLQRQEDLNGVNEKLKLLAEELEELKANYSMAISEKDELNANIKTLQEETLGLQQSSRATIEKLSSENASMEIQLKHLAEVSQSAVKSEEAMNKELDTLTNNNVQLVSKLDALQTRFDEMDALKNDLERALEEKDSEMTKLQADIVLLQNASADHDRVVEDMKLLVSDAEAKVKFAEAAKGSVEQQRSEILRMKGELQFEVLKKNEQISQLQNQIEECSKNAQYKLEESSESANQKVSELNRVIKLHESDISSKIDTINDLKAQLAIFEEKEAKMKSQLDASDLRVAELASQLETHIQQTQDRNSKFKKFVDNLNDEKQLLESRFKECESWLKEARDKCEELEESKKLLEMSKSSDTERYAKEIEDLNQQVKEQCSHRDLELHQRLQKSNEMVDATTKELMDMKKRYEEKEIENEALRSKRLAARSEIIKMAQALEKAQKEGHELKNMFQFAFLPIASEHVSSIESILMLLESSTNQLAAKSSVKIKQRTKRAFGGSKHRRASGTEDVLMENLNGCDHKQPGGGGSTMPSIPLRLVPPPVIIQSESQASAADLADVVTPVPGCSDARPLPPITPRIDRTVDPHLNSSPLHKSNILDSAHSLRSSLDKISSGLTLLNDSVEKLHDIIQLDTDDSTIAQHEQHRGSQNYRTTLDLQRENKDLKKRLKRISNILAETEDQRKTDQAAFEKAMSHKDQEFATRLMDMNTAHVIENTQLLNVKDKEVRELAMRIATLTKDNKELVEMKKDCYSINEQLKASLEQKAETIYSMKEEYETTLREYTSQRINVLDGQRSALLRRAMVAEEEVKQLQKAMEEKSIAQSTTTESIKREISETILSKAALELDQFRLRESNLQQQVVDLQNELLKLQTNIGLMLVDHENQLTTHRRHKENEINNLINSHKEKERLLHESCAVKQFEMSTQLSDLNKCLSNLKTENSCEVTKLKAELRHHKLNLIESERTIQAFVDTKYDVEMSVQNVLKENLKLQQQLVSTDCSKGHNTTNYKTPQSSVKFN